MPGSVLTVDDLLRAKRWLEDQDRKEETWAALSILDPDQALTIVVGDETIHLAHPKQWGLALRIPADQLTKPGTIEYYSAGHVVEMDPADVTVGTGNRRLRLLAIVTPYLLKRPVLAERLKKLWREGR